MAETKSPGIKLLGKEMERREFLGYVGTGLLVITGIGNVVRTVRRQSKGYSSGTYGGKGRG